MAAVTKSFTMGNLCNRGSSKMNTLVSLDPPVPSSSVGEGIWKVWGMTSVRSGIVRTQMVRAGESSFICLS